MAAAKDFFPGSIRRGGNPFYRPPAMSDTAILVTTAKTRFFSEGLKNAILIKSISTTNYNYVNYFITIILINKVSSLN